MCGAPPLRPRDPIYLVRANSAKLRNVEELPTRREQLHLFIYVRVDLVFANIQRSEKPSSIHYRPRNYNINSIRGGPRPTPPRTPLREGTPEKYRKRGFVDRPETHCVQRKSSKACRRCQQLARRGFRGRTPDVHTN